MISSYPYYLFIWLSVLTILLLIGLAGYCLRRRSVPGAMPLGIALILAALWAAGSIMQFSAGDSTAQIFWIKFQALWHLPAVIAVTYFLVEYVWPGRWLTRRNLILLSIPMVMTALMIITNDLHHLVWSSFVINGRVTPFVGPIGWILIAIGYGFVLLNLIVLIWIFFHYTQQRWFVVVLLIGMVPMRVLYLLERGHVIQIDLPLDVFTIAFTYLMYTTALFTFHIFDPKRLARQSVVNQMPDGMLVLDPQERVISLNPAAERILGTFEGKAKGQTIQKLVPAYPEGELEEKEVEIILKQGERQKVRYYTLSISSLKDWRGLAAGRLLLLRDITAVKQAQAQLLEQEKSLATLKEREQLARELHDQLSQEIALINVQAQLVCGLLEADQSEQACEQLKLLAKVARETQVDVRGQIRTLSLNAAPDKGFQEALHKFLDIFRQTYGVETELVLTDNHSTIAFSPMVEMQLLRIVQEALINIRKHAQAQRVRVVMTKSPGCMVLSIEDDGVGFDLKSIPAREETFGLGIMSKRAGEINARINVVSEPGSGTRIVVEVPVNVQVENELSTDDVHEGQVSSQYSKEA
jgi:MprA protease rhombosortase-interaction domain-containing protein